MTATLILGLVMNAIALPIAGKRIFGWAKVRYRGLAKNTHWLQISCGLANLYVARRRLLAEAL